MRLRAHACTAATIVVTALTITLAAAAAAVAKPAVPLGTAAGDYAVRPSTFLAGTGVGGGVMALTAMRWTYWGARSAVGYGTLEYNTCRPFCAAGNLRTVSARVRLYRPRRNCLYGTRRNVFTRITATFDGRRWRSTTAGACLR